MRIERSSPSSARPSSARIGSWPTLAAIEAVTSAILEREAAARAERAEPPVGFGPAGGPTAPDLRTFAEKRTASIADQLAGKKDGYRPQFNFGPPGGAAPPKPVDDKTIGEVVKAPPGFKVTLFAAPPKVGYPVTLSVAPDGEVFVAVDEQGSLGRTSGRRPGRSLPRRRRRRQGRSRERVRQDGAPARA